MSDMINIRKTVTLVETIRHEGGTPPEKPLKKGAILIVLKNPFAGFESGYRLHVIQYAVATK